MVLTNSIDIGSEIITAGTFTAGQVDLAETDESENENERGNENGNENEQGKGRQEGSHCGRSTIL